MASKEELPRVLEVQRFAAAREDEIRALSAALKSPESQLKWGHGALPRHLRRRATSHNSYIHRRRPNIKLHAKHQKADASTAEEAEQPTSDLEEPEAEAPRYENRAMRRRKGRLQRQILEASTAFVPGTVPGAPRRLETHVWHAKRMNMVTRWGHVLAEGACGKGLGSRAFLAALNSGTVIHDASYWIAFQLTGLHADVLASLSSVSDQALALSQQPDLARGVLEHDMMLHMSGSCPSGALTPAKVLFWRAHPAAAAQLPSAPAEAIIWVHPAGAADAHAALSTACESTAASLTCRADLRRLEIRGAKSDRAVSAALTLLDQGSQQSTHRGSVQNTSTSIWQLMQATGGATAVQLPHNMVLPLMLKDARLARPIKAAASLETLEEVISGAPAKSHSQLPSYAEEMREAKALASRMATAAASPANSLVSPPVWSAGSVPLPLPEQAVCQMRHRTKLAALHLPPDDLQPSVAAAPSLEKGPEGCPTLAVRRAAADNHAARGWSLIMPAGWASQFWQALIYNGARPAGQRDWRWAAAHQGVAFFPHDFPDTPAYTRLAAELHAEQERARQLRPKGRFPPGTSHPPDWAAVGSHALPKTSTHPTGHSQPVEEVPPAGAAAADVQPMEEDGQEVLTASGEPVVQEAAAAKAGGSDDLGDDTPLPAEEAPVAGNDAEGPAPMDTGPSDGGEGTLSTTRAANGTAAAAGYADRLPHAAAASGALPTPQFYVARNLAQLDAAMKPEVATAESSPFNGGVETAGDSSRHAEPPAGKRNKRLIWRPAGQLADMDALCMLRVSVHVIGPGVAEEGAAVCALPPAEAAAVRQETQRRNTLKRVHQGEGQLAAAARGGQQGSVREVLSGRGERCAEPPHIIGYVSSAAPRGLGAWRGATAICRACDVLRLRSEQKGASAQGGVIVGLRCPASTAVRAAEAGVVLDGGSDLGQI